MCQPPSSQGPTEPTAPHERGNTATAMRNLRQPGSWSWKVERLAVNIGLRVRRRSDCCGNYGEPGC